MFLILWTNNNKKISLSRDEEHNNAHNYNFDSPNALDFDLAFEKVLQLLRYEDVQIPVYDFATHSR